MERNPLIEYNDGLVVTYSDLKKDDNKEYITVYLERPSETKTDFDSAELKCPGNDFENIIGFSDDYLLKIKEKILKMANRAFSWAREDSYAATV